MPSGNSTSFDSSVSVDKNPDVPTGNALAVGDIDSIIFTGILLTSPSGNDSCPTNALASFNVMIPAENKSVALLLSVSLSSINALI